MIMVYDDRGDRTVDSNAPQPDSITRIGNRGLTMKAHRCTWKSIVIISIIDMSTGLPDQEAARSAAGERISNLSEIPWVMRALATVIIICILPYYEYQYCTIIIIRYTIECIRLDSVLPRRSL